jgi:hypothetical protein
MGDRKAHESVRAVVSYRDEACCVAHSLTFRDRCLFLELVWSTLLTAVCVGSQYDCSLGTFHLPASVIVNAIHTQGLAGRYASALCTVPLDLTPGSGFHTAVYICGFLTHASQHVTTAHVVVMFTVRSALTGSFMALISVRFYQTHFYNNIGI